MDSLVQAYSIQAASQIAEGKECSSDTGVHTLSACGGQGEMTTVARHSIRRDNSRVGFGTMVPKPRLQRGLFKPCLWCRYNKPYHELVSSARVANRDSEDDG